MGKRLEGPPEATAYSKVGPTRHRADTPPRDEREQAAQVPPTRHAHVRAASPARHVPPMRSSAPDRVLFGVPDAFALSVIKRTLNGPFHKESVNIAVPYSKYIPRYRPAGMFVISAIDNAARLPVDVAIHGRRLVVRGRDSYRQLPVPLAVVDKTLQEIFRRFRGGALWPAEPVSNDVIRTEPPLAVARSVVGAEPSEDGFLLAEVSRGRVVDVSDDGVMFTADIDEFDSTGAWVRVDLPLKEIQAGDMDLVRPGATFDISIGTPASPIAFKTHFHRLRTTPESIEAGNRLAASLPDRFDLSDLTVKPPDGKPSRPDGGASGGRHAKTST